MRDPFYRSARWRALRAAVLRSDPTCTTPGCRRRSTHADHVVPRSRGGADTLANLRGLCASCHSRVTAAADGGFGNARKRERRVGVPGCDESGRPLDPRHWWNR